MPLPQPRVDLAVAGEVGGVEPAAVGLGVAGVDEGGGWGGGGEDGGVGGSGGGGGGVVVGGGRGGGEVGLRCGSGDDVEEEDHAFADGEEDADGGGASRIMESVCGRGERRFRGFE